MNSQEKEKLRLKADVFKAMGHPIRLGIIEMLAEGEKCVCEIVELMGTDISNISKHLSQLKRNGVVADRKEGLKVYYRINMPCVLEFAHCVETMVIDHYEGRKALMCGAAGCRAVSPSND
jgi:ArsR family transcriptional regulator